MMELTDKHKQPQGNLPSGYSRPIQGKEINPNENNVYMEDVTIVLPITENGVCGLGELWDCHRSKSTHHNLFGKQLQKEHVIFHPLKTSNYNLTRLKNTEDHVKLVKLSGAMSMEFLSGLIKVEGCGEYNGNVTSSGNEEKLVCQYNLENGSVFLLPQAKTVINQTITDLLMNGNIKATHVVHGLILGAEVNAHIRVRNTETNKRDDIKGSVIGKLVFGKISASVKAKLELLDSDKAQNYETQIAIHSKPPMRQQQPSTIKEMFDLLEKVDTLVAEERHFKFIDPSIMGVPVRWVLVPIAQFLDVKVERLYMQIDETLREDFRTMLISLQDSRGPGCIKRRVLEKDNRLSLILSDPNSELSQNISKYENMLNKKMEFIFIRACKVLKEYKRAIATSSDLHAILQEYGTSDFSVVDLYAKVEDFVVDGKRELGGIHAEDETRMGADICLLTNRESLREWISTESNIKILLYTKGDSTSGAFNRLFNLSQTLKELNIEVGIALPSISDSFCLSIKVKEKLTNHDSTDIAWILGILSAAVKRDSSMESRFYTIMASLYEIELPLQSNALHELHRLVKILKVEDVHITSSYMESLECILSGNNHWIFFVPIDALDTAREAIHQLRINLINPVNANVRWVVGSLGIPDPNQHEAPLLFVFRGGIIKAICLDHLDILILFDLFKIAESSENKEPDLCVLSPDSLQCSMYVKRANYALRTIERVHQIKHSREDYAQLKMSSFNENADQSLTDALSIARSCLHFDDTYVIATVASFAIRENPEIGSILEKHGWKNVAQTFENEVLTKQDCELICTALQVWLRPRNTFLAKVEIAKLTIDQIESSPCQHTDASMSKVNSDIQSVYNDPQCPDKLKLLVLSWQESEFEQKCKGIKIYLNDQLSAYKQEQGILHVTSLIHILRQVYQNDSCFLSVHDTIKTYVDRVDLKKSHFVESSIIECIKNYQIYSVIENLAKLQYDHRLFAIHSTLDELANLNDPKITIGLLQLLSSDSFERIHWEDLWTNSSFKYLIKNVIHDHNILQMISSLKHKFNITDTKYMPEEIQELSHFNREFSEFVMPENIDSLESALNIFKKILKTNEMPPNFGEVMRKSITKNMNLERSLLEASSLIYWNTKDKLFDDVWCLQTVRKAIENISTFMEEQNSVRCLTSSEGINIFFNNGDSNLPSTTIVKTFVSVHTDFHSIFGDSLSWTTAKGYIEVCDITQKPNVYIDKMLRIMPMVLPFLLQNLKMWGGNVLQANAISSLVKVDAKTTQSGHAFKRPTFGKKSAPTNSRQTQEQKIVPFSRLDCVVALLSCADCTVAQDLLQVMMKFPMALPLVMPDLEMKEKYKVMLPLLSGNIIKWEAQSGVIVENNLFISAFRLILAVRLGTNSLGKSTILNQLMSVEHLFSSCGEPGAHRGPPLTLAGTVEFTWLTQETCGAGLWESVLKQFYAREENEIVLLANLHGDASEYPEIIQFLKKITSTYIVFVMPDEENMSSKCDTLASLTDSEDNMLYLMVDPNEYNEADCIIETALLTNDDMLGKVRQIFSKALTSQLVKMEDHMELNYSQLGMSLHPTKGVECKESQKLIQFISEKHCQTIRSSMKFQSQEKQNKRTTALWEGNEVLQEVIQLLCQVLSLPLADRLRAFTHVERQISVLSNSESANLRDKISKNRNELRRQSTLTGQNQVNVMQIKWKICSDIEQLDKISLGQEHFFRELGHIYDLTQGDKKNYVDNNVNKLPRSYAELMINGHAIELLNGDTGEMPGAWFLKICQHISEDYPNLRIFVISILGLQSSGKSTLLNALFACKFAVSVGRCTRGLFMRLLFLEKALGERLQTDAILLIDTEGLGAPEKVNDVEAEKKDRTLATFAMSVSNLTIINVLGEYMNSLTEILQIAIVAMARLEQVKMAPDILMVQHLSERNLTKTSSGQDQFCEALENAIKLTREKDVDVGILDVNCLKKLAARIQNEELLKQFRPFKNGASAGAPPSEQYHADVVDLYKTILDACQQSDNKMLFSDWYSLVQNYWSCVLNENFAVRFKNIQEMDEFIERGKQIAALKDTIDSTFYMHRQRLKTILNQAMQKLTNESQHQIRESVLKTCQEELKLIPIACQDCKQCIGVIEQRGRLIDYAKKHQCEHDVMQTINRYTQQVRKSTMKTLTQMLDAAIVGKGYSVEFLDEISRQLKLELEKRPGRKFTDAERKHIVDTIWKTLYKIANEKNIDIPDDRKIQSEIILVYENSPYVCKAMANTSNSENVLNRNEGWFDYFLRKCFKKSSNNIISLSNSLENIATSMLDSRNVEHYENGMIREINKKIDDILSKFDNKLEPKRKQDAHIFTLQIFCQEMKDCQIKWEKKHKPTEILNKREQELKTMIDTRLKFGFCAASEAILIAEYLLKAINQKATKSVNDLRVDAVLDLPWTTNSESVRLKYFECLASQVQKGQTAEAVEYFRRPKTSIDKWFSKTVDGHVCAKEKYIFKNTFTSQYEHVVEKINNCSNIPSILQFTHDYLANVDNIEYKSSLNNHDISTMGLSVFRDCILNGFKNSKMYNGPKKLYLKNPSTNMKVMKRIGCTNNCPWCGALCWGSRGHDEDSDETRKHHSSHQPLGLHGTHNKITKELLAESCHSWSDGRRVYWGDKQMKWSEAKALPECSNWKFDSHCNATFDTLMRWFFQELHQQIAQTMELRPATKDQLQTNKCGNLHLNSILAKIRVLIEK
ncbi:uncharacterized protein LOC133360810 [Lethenteron reissneri]|uniref:uncharacterized protein LOC133360810 n=1 Tax=Lethenteron reissneri TaxID=7753 RepID=UPI002AB68C06|nr:uncharacterized protein LOC133360810 [Lethenteron reissneri]